MDSPFFADLPDGANRRFWIRHFAFLFLVLLILGGTVKAQPQNGFVPFDYPNAPILEFQFDLDRSTLALIMEDTDPRIVSLFNALAYLHLRNYKASHFDKILWYYGMNLKVRGWSTFEKSANFHLYTLTHNETVIGIFVAVKSGKEMYLINMDGQFAPKQVSELVGNLNLLGIEIPELNAFGARFAPVSASTLLRTPEGDLIHEVRIQTNQEIAEPQIRTMLEEGPDELIAAMATLCGKLPDTQTLAVRTNTEGGKRIATIIITARPDTGDSSVSSMTSTDEIIQEQATPTQFRTAEGEPIYEVRIRGNQKITEAEIRATLDNAPEDIGKAIDTLKGALPYFSRITLQIEEDGTKRVATVTVAEKVLSSDYYLHATPLVQFNRVTGLLPAARLEVGKRRHIGPFWMWYIPSSVRTNLTKLSGDIGYGFGNRDINYRVGGDIIWGEPDISTLGISAQVYRATNVIAPDLLPYYADLSTAWANLWGAPQVHNYYLNEGIEMSLRWEPVGPTHSLKLTMRAESHESLQKTTDWHIWNWSSELETRENPPITSGNLRSIALQYDLSTRKNGNLGWHNTLFVEHSNPVVGSDFDFTQFQLQLRYAVSKGNNLLRTRLMLNTATGTLPIQRQFMLGGTGTLNGYPPYTFTGSHGALLNIEYLYRLSNLYHWGFLKETFVVLFLDQGQVWNTSDKPYSFDPKTSVGIGWQSGEDYMIRFYVSKSLESEQKAEVIATWYYSF